MRAVIGTSWPALTRTRIASDVCDGTPAPSVSTVAGAAPSRAHGRKR
jgi:hypothetical protein